MSAGLPAGWRLRAAAACALLPPLLGVMSLERIARVAGRLPAGGPRPPDPAAPDDAALAAYVNELLWRLPNPWRNTCLRRSVVLFHLLRRRGRPVALRIGVRRDAARGGALEAHAWLVRDGVPYLEPDPAHAARYTEIATFPGAGAG